MARIAGEAARNVRNFFALRPSGNGTCEFVYPRLAWIRVGAPCRLHPEKAMMEARAGSEPAPVSSSEILLAAAIALAALAILLRNDPGGLSGDPDSYMQLARFRDGYGIFHGGFFSRDNAPYGTVVPWTMPFDGALAIFYGIGRVFTDPSEALYFAARVVSPFFCVLVGPLMFFGLRPFFHLRARVVMAGLAATSPNLLTYGIPGEADYHTMLVWLGVLFGVALIRYLFLDRARYRHAAVAGITAAIALWAQPEEFVVIGAGLSALILHRCIVEAPRAHGARVDDLVLSGAFAITLTAGWLLDQPYEGLWTPSVDRLSIVYVSFSWLFAAALIGLEVYVSRAPAFSRPRNLVVAALLGGVAFPCWIAIQPDILRGPMSQADPALFGIWIDHVAEMQPMWRLTDYTIPHAACLILIWSSFAVLIARNSGARRWLWIASAILMVPVSLVGIRYIRVTYYAEVFGSIPLGLVLADFTRRFPKYLGYAGVAASSGAMLWAYLWTQFVWDQFEPPRYRIATAMAVCSQESLSEAIAPIENTDAVVMTELDSAAMTLYLSPQLRTVAAGYMRNPKGILDDFAFFGAHNDEDARAILDKRGVEYVLICDRGEKQRADSFGDRILHDTPAWLQQVGSSSPRPGYRLYRVRSGNG